MNLGVDTNYLDLTKKDSPLLEERHRRLEQRRALVTGGSRGIGRAIALALAGEGAEVAITYRAHRDAAAAAVSEIQSLGRRSLSLQADTASRTDVERLVADADRFLDGIDLLVNNAGVLERTPFLDITEEGWDRILDTNLKGYFLVGQTVARLMVDRRIHGAIVNVSSAAQDKASPNLAHYCISKAGVAMLTKAMAFELAPHKIRVNAVCPGLIETDLNRADIADPVFRDRRLAHIPLREIGRPEDIVSAVVFLCCETEARLITGASLFVDGGKTIWSA